jgi:hypothetical protein
MNVNDYLGRQYPAPPCWALVADVYATERGDTVTDYKTVNASIRAIAGAFRLALHKSAHGFAQVAEPVDYCVVLLGKTARTGLHHCGIYYDGRILHMLESGGQYQELSVITDEYQLVEYWAKGTA